MPNGPQRKPTEAAADAAEKHNLDLSRGTHGTVFSEGQTTVDPYMTRSGTASEIKPTYGISDKSKVYYNAHTEDAPGLAEVQAWGWAGSAARSRGEPALPAYGTPGWRPDQPRISGRPVVHDVEPHGDVDVDTNMHNQFSEMTADKLTIKDTHWIRPPYTHLGKTKDGQINEAEELGVQGTMPHVNWNQFIGPPQYVGDQPAQATSTGMNYIDLNNVGISALTRKMRSTVEHDEAMAPLGKEPLRRNVLEPKHGMVDKPRAKDFEDTPMAGLEHFKGKKKYVGEDDGVA